MDENGQEIEKMKTQQFQLQVIDSRKEPNAGQQFALTERLKVDEVGRNLRDAKRLLGTYSTTELKELSVNIIEGKIGEGTIKGTTIEVQMPQAEESIREMEEMLKSLLDGISPEDRNAKCKEIFLALTSSTILHEAVHGLLDSKPGSRFANDFERASGLENTEGKISTLLDEGIAYVIQGMNAKKVEPLGSLAPMAKNSDSLDVKQRKILGEKLKPKVAEYIQQERTVDNEFFLFASDALKEVLLLAL